MIRIRFAKQFLFVFTINIIPNRKKKSIDKKQFKKKRIVKKYSAENQ